MPQVATCPSCGANHARSFGPAVTEKSATTATVPQMAAFSSHIMKCLDCSLVYRWPPVPPELLAQYYQAMPADTWTYDPRRHWLWTRDALARWAPNRKVLDVGCFRGDFLGSLDGTFQKFGIEPNDAAAAIARTRGIELIGRMADEDFPQFHNQFGAIVMMDVIEHMYDPVETLQNLKKLLAPGGLLVLFTGDSGSWPARFSLPYYWYMAFPIHLVYLNRRYMAWLENRIALRTLAWRSSAHDESGIARRWRHNAGCMLTILWHRYLEKSWAAPAIGAVPPFRTIKRYDQPPMLNAVRDHFWTVLQKTADI